MAKDSYGIAGPKNQGSEYFVIDVVLGVSRSPQIGTSLFNFANAEAVALLVDRLLAKSAEMTTVNRVLPGDIAILSYYTAQKLVTIRKLQATASSEPDGRTWEFGDVEVASVDAFQGQQARIVIVDMVSAHLRAHTNPDRRTITDAAGLEEGETSNAPYLSAHARDAHRLCCAVTRARDGLIVLTQATLGMAGSKDMMSKNKAAVREFLKDAFQRKVLYQDEDHIDTSEEGIAMRARWSEEQNKKERTQRLQQRAALVAGGLQRPRRNDGGKADKQPRSLVSGPSGAKPPATDWKAKHEQIQIARDNPEYKAIAKPVTQRARKNERKAEGKGKGKALPEDTAPGQGMDLDVPVKENVAGGGTEREREQGAADNAGDKMEQ